MSILRSGLTYSHHLKSKHNLQGAISPLELPPYIYVYTL